MNLPPVAYERYQEELTSLSTQQDSLKDQDRWFGTVRLVLFFAAIVLLCLGHFAGAGIIAVTIGWIAFALFFVAVIANEPVRERLDDLQRRRSVYRRLSARLERDWKSLATESIEQRIADVDLPPNQRDVASDLDLLGPSSLFHFVSMAATTPGIRTLANWLTGPADRVKAQQRTVAIEALAPLRDQRIRFYTLAKEIGESSSDPDQFVKWASGPMWLRSRPWIKLWANASAVLAATMVIATVLGTIGLIDAIYLKYSLFGLFGLATFNLLFAAAVLGPAHSIFSVAMASRRSVADYQELFAAAEWLPEHASGSGNPGVLELIRREVFDGELPATEGMRRLQSVAAAGALKQSAATFLLYIPLQALLLWDIRVLSKLESWQEKYGAATKGWFDALGSLEALLSLAAVRDEQPDWVMPNWLDQESELSVQAKSIGHPLLSDAHRVCNDVTIGPCGSLLLVTGSNMSGKSTMLRSIGLNIALAGAGAPVCADSFELPSIEMGTSIRVSDNLSEGVSFYMAELQRLKSVVDHAKKLASTPGRTFLFLLDEILQGTNSRERQIAVVQVLRHLSSSAAIGAISTHDLELADEAELQAISTTVHFRETIRPDADGNEQMTFDYKMRTGVSPTTNALRLLEIVGLGGE